MTQIVTRFAPSPTGFLHIGGARTALFNWLFAKHHGGKFLLRIEDTDRERSTQPAIDAILDSMKWLGLNWDGDAVFQFARSPRHAEVAEVLVKKGRAYYCYTTPQELAAFREANPHSKFRSPWRDGGTPPAGARPVIRLKAPLEGETVIEDKVQGRVVVQNAELDDMVLLRSDGTPTYMLAVVVDDHDMGVTHIIRGDDHLTNAFRQKQLYEAMGWQIPEFAHIPLIHGADGAKLSKRHGALGAEAYRDMGFLPQALCNYLLRLGWGHGDEEIIPLEKAIEWFSLDAVGKAPSRFDMEKLKHINAHYMRAMPEAELAALLTSSRRRPGPTTGHKAEEEAWIPAFAGMTDGLLKLLPALKERAQTLVELAQSSAFLFAMPPLDEKAAKTLDEAGKTHLKALLPQLEAAGIWEAPALEALVKAYITASGARFPAVGMPLRAALTGTTQAPAVHEIMAALGKAETLERLKAVL